MFVAAAIWMLIGACFGWPRARARYYQELLDNYSAGAPNLQSIRNDARLAAVIEFAKWTLLGVLSGVSYVAWVLAVLAQSYEKEVKKSGAGEALVFSVIVFVLGAIALGARTSEWRQFERRVGRGRAVTLFEDAIRSEMSERAARSTLPPNEPRNETERFQWEAEDHHYEETNRIGRFARRPGRSVNTDPILDEDDL
ncbi:hypothetical protein [Minwuia sp. IMCC4030]|uniref:hypothetical protein n=1 Tax=Minwuia sp. IMCC4030 TaxID=3040677 RepID=UPI00247A6CB7|nr:hypothetical protein [Minwuia sp. IMCC4030]